jgi:hypothetical protein
MIETTESTHPLKLLGRRIDVAILSSPAPFLLPSRDRLPADEQTKRHVSRVGVSDTLYNSQRRASSRDPNVRAASWLPLVAAGARQLH